MGTRSTTALAGLMLLLLGAAPPPSPVERVAQARAAMAEAEKNLQHAVDSDASVMPARVKSAAAEAAVASARDGDRAAFQAAVTQYQAAKAEEAAAIKAAAPRERRELAERQKELVAARAAAQAAAGAAQKQLERQKYIETLAAPPERAGDVEVSLLHLRIAPVSYLDRAGSARTSEPLLSMLVDVQNQGKERIEYVGWNVNAIATDAGGKQYLPAQAGSGTVLGRIVQASLAPGAIVRDIIVLQRPPEGKELTITLPAFNVGGSGAIQFRIAGEKIEQSKDPLIDSKAPMVITPVPAVPVPSTQASVAGAAGHSDDGVDFPPVTDPSVRRGKAPRVKALTDVAQLLERAPGELGFGLFSVEKSGSRLAPHMSHMVDVPGSRARGVSHAMRSEVDHLDPAFRWFAFGVANADVAGFELRDGVVARIVLYYLRTDAAQRMLLLSYGQAQKPNATLNGLGVECGPWAGRNANTTSARDPILKRQIWNVLPQESPATLEINLAAMSEFEKSPIPPRR